MVIIVNSNGDVVTNIPENVYQGSNNANSIVVLAPFASSSQLTIAYRLPNGLLTTPTLMTPYGDVPSEYSLSGWYINIDESLTEYYGNVEFQVSATSGTGIVITSFGFNFTVQRGVAPILPAEPTPTIYEQILVALASIQADIVNGWVESKSLLPYDETFTYSLNSVLYYNNTFYKSIIPDNIGNPLSDTASWQELLFATEQEVADLIQAHNISGTAHSDIRSAIDLINETTIPNAITNAVSQANAYTDQEVQAFQLIDQELIDASVTAHNESGTAHPDIRAILDGMINAITFDSNAQISSWIAGTYERPDGIVVADLVMSQVIYNRTQTEDDYRVISLPVTAIGDLGILPTDKIDLTDYVQNTRTINGYALSSDITITKSNVELSNVYNPTAYGGISYGGGAGESGVSFTDLNSLVYTGFYTCYGTTANVPSASYSWYIEHINSNVGNVSATQTAIAYATTTIIYIRHKTSSTWGVWENISPSLKVDKSTAVTNLDTITETGFYNCHGSATGAPNTSYGWLVIHQQSSIGDYVASQRAIARSSSAYIVYERTKDSSWSTWHIANPQDAVLYSNTGTATDGAMTQAASTNSFVKKGSDYLIGNTSNGVKLSIQESGPTIIKLEYLVLTFYATEVGAT